MMRTLSRKDARQAIEAVKVAFARLSTGQADTPMGSAL